MRVKKTHETEEWVLRLKGKKGVRVARTSYERHEMVERGRNRHDEQ